jgi:hypothetical protein
MPNLYRRDSIGRADQGQDIYSVVRNPNAHGPAKSHSVRPLNLDRLETSAEKLQRQQMEAIKKGYLKIMAEDGSAIKLITLTAKYMFMAVVFPPYMLLYVLPQHLFLKLIPKLMKETFKMLERLPEWFSNTTTWLPNPNQLLSQLVKPFAVAKQNLDDFLKMMKHYSQAARKIITEVVAKGLELAKIPFIRTAQVFKDASLGLKTIAKDIGSRAVNINEKIENAIQQIKENIAAIVLPFVQPIVQLLETQYTKAVDYAKKGAEMVSTTVYKAIEKVKEKLLPPIEKTTKMVKDAAKWISNKIYLAAQPVVAWAQPKLEKGKQLAKRAAKAVEKVREKASQTIENLRQQTIALVAPLIVQGQNLINLMVTSPVVRLFKQTKEGNSFKQRAKDLAQGFKNATQYMRSFVVHQITKAVSRLRRWIKEILTRVKNYILDLPRRIWRNMIKVAYMSMQFMRAAGAFFVKTYQVTRLLFKFGMQLMRELKGEISLYLRNARTETRS